MVEHRHRYYYKATLYDAINDDMLSLTDVKAAAIQYENGKWKILPTPSMNKAYNRGEHPLFQHTLMMFCWYCGKVFNKSYGKTHIINHLTKKDITTEESKQTCTNYSVTAYLKVVKPWCGDEYEDWRFMNKVLTSKRQREVENASD